ncbi:MAG: hypothetical protein M3365_05915, partial [Gemmatimonadota bacterium]|nr:hypothetical protein [Gemmatimonadota bacterium]
VGTTNFANFASGPDNFAFLPSFAIYVNGREEFWMALGGTLTSHVTPTDLACQVPAPPFASASTCRFATFDEAGQITFEKLDGSTFFGPGSPAPTRTMELVIPRQTFRGILQAVTSMRIDSPWDY